MVIFSTFAYVLRRGGQFNTDACFTCLVSDMLRITTEYSLRHELRQLPSNPFICSATNKSVNRLRIIRSSSIRPPRLASDLSTVDCARFA